MSYNSEISRFKEKYEKRHGILLSDDEAGFLRFKRDRIVTIAIFGVFATLIVIGIICAVCFGLPVETPIGYLLASAMALFLYSFIPSGLSDIKNYWKKHEKSTAKKVLTKAVIADPANGPTPPRVNHRFVTTNIVLIISCSLLALVYRDSVEATLPLVLAAFSATALILDYFSRKNESRIAAEVAAGHYLLYCAKILDKDYEPDPDFATTYYLKFGDDLPLGDGFGSKKRPGYYSISSRWYEKADIGETFYFVLIKPKRAGKTGEEIYEIYQMYSANEYEPDSEVQSLVRTARSAQL